jgi:hypothetical protein
LIASVIDSLLPYESEVFDQQGNRYVLRIRPYVTLDNKIDGASIVLLDIDSLITTLERSDGQASEGGRSSQEAEVRDQGSEEE